MKFLNEIDGADKVKQDSQNRFVTDAEKADFHGHANKGVIDKFSEGSGKLLYNGNPVGEEVENLTLTTLTLGNYKINFNAVTDKLEFLYETS